MLGFNPFTLPEMWAEDPWRVVEEVAQGVAAIGSYTSFGSGMAFNLITKALMMAQAAAPVLLAFDKSLEVYALLDTFVTSAGELNMTSFFVQYACGGMNMQMIPLAAGAGLGAKANRALGGLSSMDLFKQVGGIFQLRRGQHVRSGSSRLGRFRGRVGSRLRSQPCTAVNPSCFRAIALAMIGNLGPIASQGCHGHRTE